MRKVLIFIFILCVTTNFARAGEKLKKTYLVSGKEVTAYEAIIASMRGEAVLRCSPVVAQETKAGGITLKAPKKKSESDAE